MDGHSVSTIKAAVELKKSFDQITAAEKAGSLSPDEKRKLEESVAEKVCCIASYAVLRNLTHITFRGRLGHSGHVHGAALLQF